MFSVINRPCSAGDYNQLPDVIDADAALKPLEAELDELVRRGSEACLATPFEHGSLGGFLLHRHWELDDGYSMIERRGQHASGRPALVTSAQPTDHLPPIARPSRFRVDSESATLVALEFSSDPVVVETWRCLNEQPEVLDRLCEIISASGLADKIGLGILSRDVPIADDEFLVEENCADESVVSARTLSPEQHEIVIQTGWPFVVASLPGGTQCIPYCMQAGDWPHEKFHSKPTPPE